MPAQLIYLDADDDIVSICDRLDWAQADRVLLVLPESGSLLTERLDMMRLRRHADRRSLEVGLVTGDGRVKGEARDLGFPTFTSVKAGQRSGRRVWWRGRRARFRATRNTPRRLMDEYDRREMERRQARRPLWQRWIWRYAGLWMFLLTLAAAYIGLMYSVPTATVTLRPFVQPVRASRQIVADPQLESVNFSGSSVPARLLVVTETWRATVETTGTREVPDAPARGTVVFGNRRDEPVAVPAGTRVSTSAGQRIIFQTLRDVEVPGVVGATAEADIVAVEPGPQGNVAPDLINRIEGSLALQLAVRNVVPTEGGGVRISQAVTDADHKRLRAQVLQFIQALALNDMEAQLAETEFLARDSLRIVEIYQETYSHFPGELADRLALEIRAEVHGTAVDDSEATELIYQEMVANLLPEFELVPASLDFFAGDVIGVDNQGRVSFIMIGEGQMAARLEARTQVDRVAGQDLGLAMAYLAEHLPLRDYPTVEVWPGWFDRMPYMPVRIRLQIDTGTPQGVGIRQ